MALKFSHFDVKGEYQVVETIRLRVPIQSTGGVIRSSVEVAGMVMKRSGYKKVKANSGSASERHLGIPSVSDRIAQMVIKMVLEPKIEPHFDKDSYWVAPISLS